MSDAANPETPRVRGGGWRITGLALGALLLLLALVLGWLLATTSGARFAAARAQSMLAPRLALGAIDGRLAGPLTVRDLRWADPEGGVDVRLAGATVDVGLLSLLRGMAHVEDARLEGLRVALAPSSRPPPPEGPPRAPLDPPIALRVDRFVLRDARVTSNASEVVAIIEAQLAAQWTRGDLRVRQLDVLAEQGEVHFTGAVAEAGGSPRSYRGEGEGRFAWTVGEHRFAGTLQARAPDARAGLDVQLASPLRATLAVAIDQAGDGIPWNWRLDVPAFDPRESLLPDGRLQRLAAALEGAGTLDSATMNGSVTLNDTALEIRRLAAARREAAVDLDGELAFGGGTIRAVGALQTDAQPVSGRFDLDWSEVAVPADLAGQEIRTAGDLAVSGSSERYEARGTIRAGPPGRLANLRLDLTGTSEAVQLERLDIVQTRGRLAAAGRIQLQPGIEWIVAASATRFDPGELLVEWPGRLDFRLATDGRITDQGPAASLALQDLRGTLRDRPISGRADIALTVERTVTGDADLRSGGSRIRVAGSGGAGNGDTVRADIDVADLGDWAPGAGGSLRGRIDARGEWPEVQVVARLTGDALQWSEQSVGAVTVEADVARPLEPSGRVSVDAQRVVAAGFEFATVSARLDGERAAHRLEFDARGERLDLGLGLAGGLEESGTQEAPRDEATAPLAWRGEITRLEAAVPDDASLALEAPATLALSAGGSELGSTCLSGGDIRVCVEGRIGTGQELAMRYDIAGLPLRLLSAFATLPVGLEGAVDGVGSIDRDARGTLSGQATLRSARGRVLESVEDGEEARELLAWRDLAAAANLAGEDARITLASVLNDGGSLDGAVGLAGLGGAAPQVDGRVTVELPGIGIVEAFAPQVTNVQGHLRADVTLVGPLDAPDIAGETRLAGLGFDLPQIGLKPREGEITARMAGDGPIELDGRLRSGDGTLAFNGEARLSGEARVEVKGERALAADIPGVRVVISPALRLDRDATRTAVTGRVVIPEAQIDLQRLPSAKQTRSASPDVVVIDDEASLREAAQASPLQADVEVQLGDEVKLAGYGLDAAVTGELDIRERPGQPTTASGEVRVSGGYKAYGQDLTIEQGQLLYAGTPVDNPRLAITAVRKVDTVTAGFRVSGSARAPELTVFSDPVMGQASALSYIVAGKPLDEIGQGTGEGDALQSAARQLGTAAGGLLAKNVGRRLGVDELGIKDSSAIGGAALTVGQYLSPRLYLGYGVGLFEPGQVVTLRYRISRELALEAEQATESSRAGIEFRLER